MYTGKKYHRLQVGSKVRCRFFSGAEDRFIGDSFEGEILQIRIDENMNKIFTVSHEYGTRDLKRKEIIKVLS